MKHSIRGFTLLELALASGIMLIVFLVGLKLIGECSRLTAETKSNFVALNDARVLLERVKETPAANIQGTDWNAVAQQQGLNTLPNEQAQVVVEEPATGLLRITATVNWTEGLRQRQFQLVTQRARGEG